MRGYFKYVLIRGGVLSMKLDGLLVILKLLVDNWDLMLLVSKARSMCMHIDQALIASKGNLKCCICIKRNRDKIGTDML